MTSRPFRIVAIFVLSVGILAPCLVQAQTKRPTLIVQDFRNRSYDIRHDWVGVGLAYLVRRDLQTISALRLLEDRASKANDPEPLANYVIEGEVRMDESAKEGDEKFVVFVTLDRTGESAIRRQFLTEGAPAQIFEMADYLAERIARHLEVGDKDTLRAGFGRGMTRNFLAYQQFAEAIVDRRIHVKIESYERAILLDPEFAEAYFHLARVFTVLRNQPEAEKNLRRVIELLPDYAEAHNDLGYIVAQQGSLAAAVDCYRMAIRFAPTEGKYQLNLGDVLRHLGRTQEAKAAYQEAVRVQPGNAEAIASLAMLEAEHEGVALAAAGTTSPPGPGPSTTRSERPAQPSPRATPQPTPLAGTTPAGTASSGPESTPAGTVAAALPVPLPTPTPLPPPAATATPVVVAARPNPRPAATPRQTPVPMSPTPSATTMASPGEPAASAGAPSASLNPRDRAELELGEKSLLRARGDRAAATQHIEAARSAAAAGDRATLYVSLGQFYLEQKMNHAAIESLKTAMELGSIDRVRVPLAEAYERIGYHKDADELLGTKKDK